MGSELPPDISRRKILATSLGCTGFSLADFLQLQSIAKENKTENQGKAKSCIILFAWGGMSHLETWDPKPEAPKEIRGTFNTIPTATPGIHVGEHMPYLAKQTNKLAIVRSMHHGSSAHGKAMYWNFTGINLPNRILPPTCPLPPVIGLHFCQSFQNSKQHLQVFHPQLEFHIHWLITEPFKLESMGGG